MWDSKRAERGNDVGGRDAAAGASGRPRCRRSRARMTAVVNGSSGDAPEPRVSVVVPALNEAANIGHVLASLPGDVYEVILVDGNSTDGTVAAARAALPEVRVVGQSGRGKGDALRCGFE